MIKRTAILTHEMVKIFQQDDSYIVAIRMRDGKHALQRPFPADQRGLVGAMSLAIDVLAGKIILERVVDLNTSNERGMVLSIEAAKQIPELN